MNILKEKSQQLKIELSISLLVIKYFCFSYIISSIFLTRLVIVENNLSVVRGVNLLSSHILILLHIRIHIYHLPISLVSEKQA